MTFASVPKFAIVGVCALVEFVLDHAAVAACSERSTKFGTLPAVMRKPSTLPCIAVPLKELRVRPHGCDGGELVDDDSAPAGCHPAQPIGARSPR